MKNTKRIIIDAGVANLHIKIYDDKNKRKILIPNDDTIKNLFKKNQIWKDLKDKNYNIYITGKLAEIVRDTIGYGEIILSSASIWTEAKYLLKNDNRFSSIGIIDLSASGYTVIAIDKNGELIDDLLITNPRCGAGSGINLSRILQKLDIKKKEVDNILKEYLGKSGKEKRNQTKIRADRCGVFSSSATISDKNQGIPLENALAVTMKSEVLKACKKITKNIDKIYLTGRIFDWQFMRDCASDYLENNDVKKIVYDEKQELFINGVQHLIESIGLKNFRTREIKKLSRKEELTEYPSFKSIKNKYKKSGIFKRLLDEDINNSLSKFNENTPINIGLDVGSTMAKMLIADADTDEIIFKSSYDNHGDTIETIKHIFKDILSNNIKFLNIQNIGITGSGRYQVQNVLQKVYPDLNNRIFTLVENYAHAHGSMDYAKKHINDLKKSSHKVNDKFYVLIDIGGEDTKVSIISVKKEELFDNVMNIKCSAGTGSLVDTLKSLFGIDSINEACIKAYEAKKAYEINATCAVFLMENAKKMQALGYEKDEILASCNYAIVENMARTLWNQVEFPKNAVVLLHGQTMLSDPLPLAVTHRLQENGNMYSLIPPLPGHRACIGLIKSIKDKTIKITHCELNKFINLKFKKKIIECRGVACGDKNACCSRTLLSSTDEKNKMSLLLGGCTAVNELAAGKKIDKNAPDAYKDIWEFIDNKFPRSKANNRLIIPRSFAVSEQAYFLSKIFENLGIPVYVDNVIKQDILEAQPLFDTDVCAPLIGAVGQFIRLAQEKHGVIIAPQIDFLPTEKTSLGRTCTTNQGGMAIAKNFAKLKNPKCNIQLFDLSIKKLDPIYLARQFINKLKNVFKYYEIKITEKKLIDAIQKAINKNTSLKNEITEKTEAIIKKAIEEKRNITIVCGREYILNPGIYDSHAGKLLKDKGVAAIPSYALEIKLDPDFNYIYWRNPHDIITKINSIANHKLYKYLKNKNLKELIKKIELGKTDSSLSTMQVSTFRCGPDTVITPTINKITQKMPNLFIQSDAIIEELAHLENRVNTYINQLNKNLHKDFSGENFDIKLIEQFDAKSLNQETDVVYFPTLHDNRTITSAFRATGMTIIDNFEDETYNLEKKIRMGRKYAGDSICAPLAGVFADMLLAVEDFKKRKKENDPLIKGKKRILIFDNKGTGPCRQGQYYEMHKMLLNQQFGCKNCNQQKDEEINNQIKLLVGHEKDGFNIGVDEWALIQSFQGGVMQGILHSILLKYGSNCKDYKQYQEFYKDYLKLKKEIFKMQENDTKPSEKTLKIIKIVDKFSVYLGIIFKYFGYGLYKNNGLRKKLNNFTDKWKKTKIKGQSKKTKIHIEGEAYMRAAQIQDIFYALIDSAGFQTLEISYSPLWCYAELLLEYEILKTKEENDITKDKKIIKKNLKHIAQLKLGVKILRNIIAKPLYNASKIIIPDEMTKILKQTRSLLPTIKPHGELPPYIGEAILKIKKGTDLFLNVAPEGCMVSSMGQLFSRPVLEMSNRKARIANLFTLNGETNHEQIQMALLKTMGPENYYKKSI